MHGEIGLGGPLFWVLTAFVYAVGALALFVTGDPFRSRRQAAFRRDITRWLWAVPQAVYLLLFLWANLRGFDSMIGATIFVVATPVAFIAQIAYLLRVVYPSPARLAEREASTAAAPAEHSEQEPAVDD